MKMNRNANSEKVPNFSKPEKPSLVLKGTPQERATSKTAGEVDSANLGQSYCKE